MFKHNIKIRFRLLQLVTNKEAEFTALEQKTDHMTGSLERLQSELILAEEKEAERLTALRESEKVRAFLAAFLKLRTSLLQKGVVD